MPNKFLFSYMGSGDSSQILVPVKKHLTDKATFLGPLISWSTFHSHMLGACSKRASAFVLHREASHIKTLLCSLNLYFSLWSVPRQCGLLCKKLPVHVLGFAAFLLCWPQRVSLTVFVSVSSCFVNMSLKRKCKPGPWLGISLGAGLLWSSVQQVGKGTELRLLASQLPTKTLEAAQNGTELTRVLKWKCGGHTSKRRCWVSASPLLVVPETMVNSANCQGSVGAKVGQFPGKVSRFGGNWFWKR